MVRNNQQLLRRCDSKNNSEMLHDSLSYFMRNNKFYVDLLDGLLEAVIIHKNNKIVFANRFALRMFSISSFDKIIDKNFTELVENYLISYNNLNEDNQDGSNYNAKLIDGDYEYDVKIKNSNITFDYEEYNITYIQPSFNVSNNCFNEQIFHKEIVEKSNHGDDNIMKAIDDEESKWEIINKLKKGIAVYRSYNMGKDFSIVFMNVVAEELIDIKYSDYLNKNIIEVFPNLANSRFLRVIKRVYTTGNNENASFKLYKDNKYKLFNGNYFFKLKNGDVVSVFENIQEEIFYDSKYRMLSMMFDKSKDMIFFIGNDGEILDVNKAALKLYGYTKREIVSKTIFDLSASKAKGIISKHIQLASRGGILYNTVHKDKDGREFIVEVSSVGIVINEKKVVCSIVRNISSRNTSYIDMDIIRQNEINQNRYEDYISKLIPILAHELRTPLNVLMCSMQVLNLYMEDSDTIENNLSKIKYNSSVMQQSSYRLLKLINNIIDSTIIDSNGFRLNCRLYDIVEIIEDTVFIVSNYVNENIKSKDIEINFFTSLSSKFIYLDLERLQNILLKILSNSVKFSEDRNKIYISIGEDMYENLEIVIYNMGATIDGGDIQHIFDKFSFNKNKLAKSHEGVGLGLFIVRNIVELHGWSIEARNCVDMSGSKFILKIPYNRYMTVDELDRKTQYDILEEELIQKIKIEFSDI
ncbi:PAS domain-containing protein [Clostridium sp. YIM B02505]|uniref:histidine kinase n=1 Tax=Clostridium yunnanense TaxID=2800325 RepID=A0ABS1EJ73_9CLOT|nr:PAS domain-containing sensor histidine kinase [Clostridium yunnanense]MBK1809414.1 PAS domain-containing protein [Clostridium yunnanense]